MKKSHVLLISLIILVAMMSKLVDFSSSDRVLVDGHFYLGQSQFDFYVNANLLMYKNSEVEEAKDNEVVLILDETDLKNSPSIRVRYSDNKRTIDGRQQHFVESLSGQMQYLMYKGQRLTANKSSVADIKAILGEPDSVRFIDTATLGILYEHLELGLIVCEGKLRGFFLGVYAARKVSHSPQKK